MKGNRSKTLPAFRSVDEFVAFFETHDMGEYLKKLPEVEVEISIERSKPGLIQVSAGQLLR